MIYIALHICNRSMCKSIVKSLSLLHHFNYFYTYATYYNIILNYIIYSAISEYLRKVIGEICRVRSIYRLSHPF